MINAKYSVDTQMKIVCRWFPFHFPSQQGAAKTAQAPQIAKNGRTTGFAQTPPTSLDWNTGALGLVTTVSCSNPFLQGGFINTSILGFQRTSPNFKLWNYRFSSEFLLSLGITTAKHLYLYKISVRKGSSFCDRGFCGRGIQLAAKKY